MLSEQKGSGGFTSNYNLKFSTHTSIAVPITDTWAMDLSVSEHHRESQPVE